MCTIFLVLLMQRAFHWWAIYFLCEKKSLKHKTYTRSTIQVQCNSVKVWIRSRKWNRFIQEMFYGDVLLFAFDIKIDMRDNWIRQYLICNAINKYKKNCNFTSGSRHINFVLLLVTNLLGLSSIQRPIQFSPKISCCDCIQINTRSVCLYIFQDIAHQTVKTTCTIL